MTPRQLALIAIAFAALLLLWGAAALIRRDGGPARAGALPALERGAVDTVRVARGTDTTVLARRDSAAWSVNGHPADAATVATLLDALADTSRREEPVAERTASHAGLGVDSAAGIRVRVAGRGGALADLVVGNRTPDLDGGYIRRAGDSVVFLVRGGLAEQLSRTPDEWRDRRIAAVVPDSVGGIELTRGRRTLRLERGASGWVLAGGRPADTAAVRGLLDAYRRVEAAGFARPAQADSARFDPADRRARLLRPDGTPLITLALDSMSGGFWARADTGATVYRLESWDADRLVPADSTLRARPASP